MGWVFPGWLCFAAILAFRPTPTKPLSASTDMRWLLLMAAAALLARMALNPRIYHYGYCQAALAGIVVAATAFRTLPDVFGLAGPARWAYLAALGASVALGMARVERESAHFLGLKTQALGEGADRFYGYDPRADPTTYYLEAARGALAAKPEGKGLLVLPEGVTLNYLLRRPSPSHVYNFNPYWLNWRESVVADLTRRPPDHVVLIGRDMREYGVQRFGESPEHGSTVMEWVKRNCAPEWRLGGDPLDVREGGVVILKRIGQ